MLARALEEADDPIVMDVAAKTLGHLVKSGGAMTSDIVEQQVGSCDPGVWPGWAGLRCGGLGTGRKVVGTVP